MAASAPSDTIAEAVLRIEVGRLSPISQGMA